MSIPSHPISKLLQIRSDWSRLRPPSAELGPISRPLRSANFGRLRHHSVLGTAAALVTERFVPNASCSRSSCGRLGRARARARVAQRPQHKHARAPACRRHQEPTVYAHPPSLTPPHAPHFKQGAQSDQTPGRRQCGSEADWGGTRKNIDGGGGRPGGAPKSGRRVVRSSLRDGAQGSEFDEHACHRRRYVRGRFFPTQPVAPIVLQMRARKHRCRSEILDDPRSRLYDGGGPAEAGDGARDLVSR